MGSSCKAGGEKKVKISSEIIFGNNELIAKVLDIQEDGTRIVEFKYNGILKKF